MRSLGGDTEVQLLLALPNENIVAVAPGQEGKKKKKKTEIKSANGLHQFRLLQVRFRELVDQDVIAVRKRETRCEDLINIYNKG